MSKSEEERKELQRRRSLEWYYRNRERCMAIHRLWYSTMTEDQREKNKARNRKWYAEHKEEQKSKKKAYRAAHRDELKAKARAGYSAEKSRVYRERPEVKAKRKAYRARIEVKARENALRRAKYAANKSEMKERSRKYRDTHPEIREHLRIKSAWSNAERDQRCREDPEFYAQVRAYDRKRKALKAIREGRKYKPNIGRRIPDYWCKGEQSKNDAKVESLRRTKSEGLGLVLSSANLAMKTR